MIYRLRPKPPLLTALAIAISCSACSTLPPKELPVLVQCPKPVISPQLLKPVNLKALNDLETFLSGQPMSPAPAPANSTR